MPSWELFEQQDQAYKDAARHHRPRFRGAGIHPGLGTVRRLDGVQHRHGNIRGICRALIDSGELQALLGWQRCRIVPKCGAYCRLWS